MIQKCIFRIRAMKFYFSFSCLFAFGAYARFYALISNLALYAYAQNFALSFKSLCSVLCCFIVSQDAFR